MELFNNNIFLNDTLSVCGRIPGLIVYHVFSMSYEILEE